MGELSSESLENLQAKLLEYRSSLDTVEAALANDATDPQLVRLRRDLVEVIGLTEDLAKFKLAAAQHESSPPQRNPPDSTEQTGGIDTYHSSLDDDHNKLSESCAEVVGVNNEVVTNGSGAATVDVSSRRSGDKAGSGQHLIGRTCIVSLNGNKRFGEIAQIQKGDTTSNDQPKGSKKGEAVSVASGIVIVVEVIGSLVKANVSPEAVQLLHQCKHLTPGTRCQAIASDDGKLHTCIIEQRTLKKSVITYKVKFFGSGETEDLKADRLYVPPEGPSAGSTAASSAAESATSTLAPQRRRKAESKEIVTPGGYRIPEFLQLKPTDSQHQIQAKKRKIQMLKKEQRQENIELEAKRRQTSWLSHNRKMTSKTSASSNAVRESIFCTSEAPTGKVGVTNSGRGMTTFDKRQRHDYEDPNDN